MQTLIQITPQDNVAIAIKEIPAGTTLENGLTARQTIPQAHKIALKQIPAGQPVIRYGVNLGFAVNTIEAGSWVNEFMLELPSTPEVEHMEFYGTMLPKSLPEAPQKTWEGYRNPRGGFAGTRNILAISTTVQCVAGVVNLALAKIKQELLPKYPNVDDVVALNHTYGCGVAINAPDAVIPIRAIRNLMDNPNFGGEYLIVGLGCEKLSLDRLFGDQPVPRENVVILQEEQGFEAMMRRIVALAEAKLAKLNERRRETLPLSTLCIGTQCGGSDAFSGVSANPAIGYASDLLVEGGATVLFSEVTEVRDAVHILAARCVAKAAANKLAQEMRWYDEYLEKGSVDRSANPTPGNKQGGLANIVEKAMGSIAKSGHAPIVEVLSPGERPSEHGLIFAATPASDFVCGTMQLASGIGLQVFSTGRGTPYGLAAAPVIKVSTRTELKTNWPDLIDFDAGPIASGEATIPELGEALFHYILAVASGTEKPWAETYKIHNDLAIFNPAPIT